MPLVVQRRNNTRSLHENLSLRSCCHVPCDAGRIGCNSKNKSNWVSALSCTLNLKHPLVSVAMAGDLGEGGTLSTSSVSHHAGKLSSCISGGRSREQDGTLRAWFRSCCEKGDTRVTLKQSPSDRPGTRRGGRACSAPRPEGFTLRFPSLLSPLLAKHSWKFANKVS